MNRFKQLKGAKFGFWEVLQQDKPKKKQKRNNRDYRWICRCICGTIRSVCGGSLRDGTTKSCGCRRTFNVTGEKHYAWKGGIYNVGSLAWCNKKLDSLRQGRKRNGGATISSTPDEVQILWDESKGRCVVCKRKPNSRHLHLDHNKETGIVRGFLCGTCNVALGMANDSPKILRRLAKYLEERS